MKDDQYRGYDIPADTMIIPNIWSVDISVYHRFRSLCSLAPTTGRAMTRDERMYPKPELFNPDRFMNQDKTEADLADPKDFIFGFGRRQVIPNAAGRSPEPIIISFQGVSRKGLR